MILHTEILGEGEPVVFLHSGLQTGLTDFEDQRESIKQNHKVILPDLRGHGKSVNNDFSNYFEDAANDLKQTFDYLGIGSPHEIGSSLGGLVALLFAKKFPNQLKSLALSGVTADKPENWMQLHEIMIVLSIQIPLNHILII